MNALIGTGKGIAVLSAGRVERVLTVPNVRDFHAANGLILAATGAGLYRSSDGGRHWAAAALDGLEVWQIRAGPDGTLYAVTQPAGLYRSTDGGDEWSSVDAKDLITLADVFRAPPSGASRSIRRYPGERAPWSSTRPIRRGCGSAWRSAA